MSQKKEIGRRSADYFSCSRSRPAKPFCRSIFRGAIRLARIFGAQRDPRGGDLCRDVIVYVAGARGAGENQVKKFERFEAGLLGGLFSIVGLLIMVLEH